MFKRNFDTWLDSFRNSIATYGYYIDFEKVHHNVEAIKVELNILNALIGSANIKADFEALLKKYPEVLPCIPLLLAVRLKEKDSKIYCQDENGGYSYEFDNKKLDPLISFEQYSYFMEKTGLFDLLQNHVIHNLVDYVTGV
ncbi:DpnII family type II restriction endonuclease, partial [uncultured Megasphaera sp.]|uniref:DpnII family type II restriction endonuclease n=1 Tax=uncultured Megasphaera sp. TaxID=165188 RepID=UPI002597C887